VFNQTNLILESKFITCAKESSIKQNNLSRIFKIYSTILHELHGLLIFYLTLFDLHVQMMAAMLMAGWFIKLHTVQSHPLADTLFHFGQTTPKQTIKLRNQHLYEIIFQCQNQTKLTIELSSIT
jgi:hypothetical protein